MINGKQLTSQCFCKRKTKTKKILKHFLGGCGLLFADIRFSLGVLKPNPQQERVTSVLELA